MSAYVLQPAQAYGQALNCVCCCVRQGLNIHMMRILDELWCRNWLKVGAATCRLSMLHEMDQLVCVVVQVKQHARSVRGHG